jgi:uncharacterized membrane protein YgaE (UPF0421/DUF939 family)
MGLPDLATLRERLRTEWPQVVRIIIAAAVGWWICVLIEPDQVPIFVIVVPLMAMRDQPFSALNVSFDRIVGVIAGVLLGILVVGLLGVSALSAAVVLGVGLLAGIVLRLGPNLNVQVSLSALLVFTSTDPNVYGWTRLWETLVGSVVTVGLSPFLFPPDAAKQYRLELRRVCLGLSQHLAEAAALVGDAPRNHEALEALQAAAQRTQTSAQALPDRLASARRAVRNNPLRRRDIGPLETLAVPTAGAVETARWVRLMVEEVTDLSGRPDVDPVWATSGPSLSRVLQSLAAVIDAVLVKDTSEAASVRPATDELYRWRERDKHPLAVVMRRPAFRLVRVVASLTGEPLPDVPHDIRDHVGADLVGESPADGGEDHLRSGPSPSP